MAYACRHFGNHTPAEVRLAFDLAITRQLELKEADISCYQSFSVEYFSRIMSAYRSWASARIKALPQVEAVSAPPTKEQLLDIDIAYVWAKRQDYNRKLKPPLRP